MNFTVVEFLNDKSMETVPSEWLTPQKKHCLWPPTKDYTKLKKMLKGDFSLKEGSWNKIGIRILKNVDSYYNGKLMESKFEYSSNCDTDVERLPVKRKVKRKFRSSSDSDDEKPIKSRKAIPPFPVGKVDDPKKCILYDVENSLTFSTENSEKNIYGENPASNTFSKEMPISVNEIAETCFSLKPAQVLNSPYLQLEETESVSESLLSGLVFLGNIPSAQHGLLIKKVETMTYELELMKKELKKLQSSIINLNPSKYIPSSSEAKALNLPFPIKNESELECVEVFLEDAENMDTVVKFLTKLGGNSTKEYIVNILNKVFGTAFSRNFSLHGRKGKKAFKNLKLYKAVLSAALLITETNEKVVNERIGLYLAGACDRYGGRKIRSKELLMNIFCK